MLNIAKKKVEKLQNVHLVIGDAENLPFRQEAFSEITCSRAFKFFPNPSKALCEAYRSLKPGKEFILHVETSDPLWIKIALKVGLPSKVARYEWRYRKNDLLCLFKHAGFQVVFTGCLLYFGRSFYELADKYFPPLVKLLELIDSHVNVGRNIMIIGQKLD